MDWIGAAIFIVIIFLSIAQKIKEQMEQTRAQKARGAARPEEMSDRARKMIYGEPGVREARPKGSGPGPRESTPARELLETLMGVEIREAEEGEWQEMVEVHEAEPAQGVAPPPPLPQQAQQRGAPTPHVSADPQRRQRRLDEERRRLEQRQEGLRAQRQQERQEREGRKRERAAEQRRREQTLDKQRRQQQATRQRSARQPKQRVQRHAGRQLFGDLREVRKAIVFAEILKEPKAFQD